MRFVCFWGLLFEFGLVGFVYATPALPPLPPLRAGSLANSASVVPLGPLPHVKGGAFDFRFVNVGQLVDLLYGDALHIPHVISSDVLNDPRLVSFQYDGKGDDLRAFVKVFLDSLGFKIVTRDGVDFVTVKSHEDDEDARVTFVYRPKYRTAAYLSKLVQPLFGGRVNAGSDAPANFEHGISNSDQVSGSMATSMGAPNVQPSAAFSAGSIGRPAGFQTLVSTGDDVVIYGKASEVQDIAKVLPELDKPPGEVVVRGWVYEVSNTNATNSAFSIATHVLDGQISLANGSAAGDASALTFDSHFLNVAISALSADTRFREVSDPNVRVVSGDRVSLNVGSKVPTLGSVSYQGATGAPVQSVDYQDAGVIFQVQPTVMDDAIQVVLDEQISSFVPTTTGVNNSPTKNTREMSTTVTMRDGEVIVLGGLVQDSDTSAVNHENFLPHFLDGKSSSAARTEVLLVLQVQRVEPSRL